MTEPERTPDGRHIVVDGRRWRASDPHLPEALRADLVGELMAARRAVRDARGDGGAVTAARARVQDAKVALGERGRAWWEDASEADRRVRIAATCRALARRRDHVGFSDVVEVDPGDDTSMVHDVPVALVDDGDLEWCGIDPSCVVRPGPDGDGSG